MFKIHNYLPIVNLLREEQKDIVYRRQDYHFLC